MNKIPLNRTLHKTLTPILLLFLNSIFALVRIFVEGWRWWSRLAVAGAVVLSAYGAMQPMHYRSQGTMTITPRYLLEGYMLATQELTNHYTVRLTGDERIERAMAMAGTEIKPLVESTSQPGMVIALTVEHPSATVSEAFTRALLLDLRDEILIENRTRIENDRLTVDLSPTSFPQPTTPSWQWYAAVGAFIGFILGLQWIYFLAFLRRGQLRTETEARKAVGLPALGIIPRQ